MGCTSTYRGIVAVQTQSLAFQMLFLTFAATAIAQHSGGSGTAEDPYWIATATDLIALGETPADYDKHFLLTADIDLDPNLPGRQVFAGAVIGGRAALLTPPPGTDGYRGTPFTGGLDGNDHEIHNLEIDTPWDRSAGLTGAYVGLVAQIGERGEVKHLGLRNVRIGAQTYVGAVAGENRGTILLCRSSGRVTGRSSIGGLVGCNRGGMIVACQSTGSVQGYSVGGLVGLNSGGTISSSSSDSTVVKDKHFGDIIGFDYAGGLVGHNADGGTISSSYSSGDVVGDLMIGGLVGSNSGTVYSCYSGSPVTGGTRTGGLVGSNEGGIASCYATGNVSGSYRVGGLVGDDGFGGIVTSYSTGKVTGKEYVGGLIGESLFTSAYLSYWAIEASGLIESADGEGKTSQQMMSRETFAGWGHGVQWILEDGKDYPRLTWEGTSGRPITDPPHRYSGGTGEPNDPYLVRTADDLARIGRSPADWDAWLELVNAIDMTSVDPNRLLPIGTNGFPFSGHFDGRDHTVRGFNASGMQAGFTGVFGWIGTSGTVRHLHLKDVVMPEGCVVGGLAGFNEGTILACSTTGQVSAGYWGGGLVGDNRGSVAFSCAACEVSERGPAWVGGLVAVNRGTVSSCYATGTAQGWCVGGLVGDNRDGTIMTSYATTAVKRRGPVDNAGGLVSRIGFDDGRASRGRPARPPDEGYGVVTASFWDIQTSGFSDGWAGTGLATSEMQKAATFLSAGWDFVGETANGTDDIWWILEGHDYPRLWWEAASVEIRNSKSEVRNKLE